MLIVTVLKASSSKAIAEALKQIGLAFQTKFRFKSFVVRLRGLLQYFHVDLQLKNPLRVIKDF